MNCNVMYIIFFVDIADQFSVMNRGKERNYAEERNDKLRERENFNLFIQIYEHLKDL